MTSQKLSRNVLGSSSRVVLSKQEQFTFNKIKTVDILMERASVEGAIARQ